MTALRRIIAIFTVIPLIGYAAPATLQKDMSFAAARKLLLKEKWQPIKVHAHDDYAPIGVERELTTMNINEFDSCSIDYSNCVMRYKRGDKCLSLFTIGEKIKYMRVVDWTDECPVSPAPTSSGKEQRH